MGMFTMKKTTRIISALLAIFMLFSLTGCVSNAKKAEKEVSKLMGSVRSFDLNTINSYFNEKVDEDIDLDDPTAQLILKTIFSNINYNIISSEEVDEDTVNVKTEITAIDMKPILATFLKDALAYAFTNAFSSTTSEEDTEKKMAELFTEAIENSEKVEKTVTVDIEVNKDAEGNWKVEAGEAFVDALLGGLVSALEDLGDSFNFAE